MDVKLPNGKVIQGVPEGTPKEQIQAKAIAAGLATEQDFGITPSNSVPAETPQEQGKEGAGFMDNAIGALENLRSMGAGIISEPVAGLSGLVSAGINGADAGAETVKGIQDWTSENFSPKTEAGINQAKAMGDFLAPVGEALESTRSGIGDFIYETTGSPLAAAIGTAVPDAIMSLLGTKPVASASRNYNTATKQAVADILKNSPQSKAAGRYIIDAAGKVKTSKAFKGAVGQGFDEATMAAVKGAKMADKRKMMKMLGSLEDGLKDARKAVVSRPTDVVGDSAVERVSFLKKVNRQAGKEIEAASNGLKGKPVDFDPAVQDFMQNLDGIGVKLDSKNRPIFSGSDIEGATAAENFIKKIVNRMRDTKAPDAYDVHRMKRFIDEQVTYGKVGEGLSGRAEGIVKNLRSNLDNALDGAFPDYDAANTKYADTISALDSLQSGVGRIDFSGANANKALGQEMRKVMSNYKSRANILSALDEVDGVAKKYGAKFDDDIITQALFADELDSMFDLQNRTTFKGQTKRGIDQAARAAQGAGGALSVAAEKAGEAIDKVRGVTNESKIKSLKELIREGNK
ncbi:putative ejection protein [Pseudoalteromonas virus vB_PspP-H6/1]|nr:putative ejection protein [Pseudoalteromonas virus vB_PspP-H6/1]